MQVISVTRKGDKYLTATSRDSSRVGQLSSPASRQGQNPSSLSFLFYFSFLFLLLRGRSTLGSSVRWFVGSLARLLVFRVSRDALSFSAVIIDHVDYYVEWAGDPYTDRLVSESRDS